MAPQLVHHKVDTSETNPSLPGFILWQCKGCSTGVITRMNGPKEKDKTCSVSKASTVFQMLYTGEQKLASANIMANTQ